MVAGGRVALNGKKVRGLSERHPSVTVAVMPAAAARYIYDTPC